MPEFNIETTVQQIADAYPGRIAGRVFLITGATSGLGLAFAKFLAGSGAGTVIVTGRSEEKLKQPLAQIEAARGNGKTVIKRVLMDLTDYQSVKKAAKEIGDLGIQIDVLVNNAGIMAVPYKKVNGHESHFVANHLGPFLFTNLILDTINQGGRILSITSSGHQYSPVRFNDLVFEDGKAYNKWQAYGQSKSANILFAKALTRRLKSRGIESFSVHPGAIPDTNLGTHLDFVSEGLTDKDGKWQIPVITVDQGIANYLYAAISPEIQGRGGAFIMESQIRDTLIPETDEDAEKLWDVSNRILGTSFGKERALL